MTTRYKNIMVFGLFVLVGGCTSQTEAKPIGSKAIVAKEIALAPSKAAREQNSESRPFGRPDDADVKEWNSLSPAQRTKRLGVDFESSVTELESGHGGEAARELAVASLSALRFELMGSESGVRRYAELEDRLESTLRD